MQSALSFSLLFSSLLSPALAEDLALKADEHPPMDCFPTSCGFVTNITYPFWVYGQQPPHCGFPSMMLTCRNRTPVLEMSPSVTYQVRKIFYGNQSVVLAIDKFILSVCPVHYWNMSFGLTRFKISKVNRELVFLSDCSGSWPDYAKVSCDGNTTFVYFGGENSGSPSGCKSATMPVLDYLGANITDYSRIIRNGFLVEWTATTCTECRDSRGQCGYSNSTKSFMCICPDRAHWKSCPNVNNVILMSGKVHFLFMTQLL